MNDITSRSLFRITVKDKTVAAAHTMHDITDAVRCFGPDTYQIEEVIADDRAGDQRVSRFWGWVTHDYDGTISIEPCLSILEG